MNKKKFSTKFLVEMALLVAIILIMAFTPLGYIKTAGIEITLIVVPVAVGAVTLGPAAGAILGGVFGLASFLRCFGLNAFGAMLLSINRFWHFCCMYRPVSDGLADRTDLSGNPQNKNTIECINHNRESVLSAFKYHVFYEHAGIWVLPDRVHPVVCSDAWCQQSIFVCDSICRNQRTG